MIRNSTYRLHPGTLRRALFLARIAGANRYLWNRAIGENEDAMRAWRDGRGPKPSFSFFDLGRGFTALRRSDGHAWLRELPYAEVRYALKRFSDAMKAAAQGQRGFPKRKRRSDGDSFTIPSDVRLRHGRLRVARVGWMALSRRGPDPWAYGKAKQAAVFRRAGRWYATVSWEVPDAPAELPDEPRAVGVDMNCGQVATSDGEFFALPRRDLERLEARKRRCQRKMMRRKRVPVRDEGGNAVRRGDGSVVLRDSNRRARARRQYARACKKIADVHRNWAHQTSRALADRYDLIVVEDLKVAAMTKSGKGTAENPGRGARRKAGLNRSILATCWGQLRRHLEAKAVRVAAVDPAHTSRTCHRCGVASSASRRSQAEFRCVSCGHAANADVNAALNILASGLGAAGRGGALAAAGGPLGGRLARHSGDPPISGGGGPELTS